MSDSREISGQCLCGAVTMLAVVDAPTLTACHCDMCRRMSGGVFLSVMTEQGKTHAKGPIKTYRSSDWAERAFCDTCGSTLWYSTLHDGARYLSAGLFDNAGGARLTVEYFADQCPAGYRLEGDHKRLSEAETIAYFTDGGEPGA